MQALPKATIRKICAGQVIVDIVSAIKELLENSLDAGATRIELFLDGDGLDYFYVKDNGDGISRENLPDCAKRYFTSKLDQYEDLLDLTTYGFRGEALNSLCSVSESVSITTKTREDANPMYALSNRKGEIITTEEILPGHSKRRIYLTGITESGTEIRVNEIFKPFPVRLQVQKNKTKQQLRQIRDLVIAYSLIQPGVSYSLSINDKPNFRFVRPVMDHISDCICDAFGPTLLSQLESIDTIETDHLVDLEALERKQQEEEESNSSGTLSSPPEAPSSRSISPGTQKDPGTAFQFRIEGFIPKHFQHSSISVVARSSNDRAFIYVNNRPVDFPALTKLITKAYRMHLEAKTTRYPFILMNIQLPTHTYDINLTPDKRKVFFNDQKFVLQAVSTILSRVYMLSDAVDMFAKKKNNNASQGGSQMSSVSSGASTQAYGSKMGESSPQTTQSYLSSRLEVIKPGSIASGSLKRNRMEMEGFSAAKRSSSPPAKISRGPKAEDTGSFRDNLKSMRSDEIASHTMGYGDEESQSRTARTGIVPSPDDSYRSPSPPRVTTGHDINAEFDVNEIRRLLQRRVRKAKSPMLSQAQCEPSPDIRVIGSVKQKENGFIVYEQRQVFLLNSALVDEAFIFDDLCKSEEAKKQINLPSLSVEEIREKSHRIVKEQNFIPSRQGLQKTLEKLKAMKIETCPHGKPLKNRLYQVSAV